MKKRFAILLLATIIAIACVAVYAIDSTQGDTPVITDAIKACDVCEEHLVQNCEICSGDKLKASYAHYCPHCGKYMTRCCSCACAKNDYHNSCLVMEHPDY